jgi:hypothetical protein
MAERREHGVTLEAGSHFHRSKLAWARGSLFIVDLIQMDVRRHTTTKLFYLTFRVNGKVMKS